MASMYDPAHEWTFADHDGQMFVDGLPVYEEAGRAYIDPSGATPDGMFFPLSNVEVLVRKGWIVPNLRDNPNDDVMGYGFQIVGDEDESAAIADAIYRKYGGE